MRSVLQVLVGTSIVTKVHRQSCIGIHLRRARARAARVLHGPIPRHSHLFLPRQGTRIHPASSWTRWHLLARLLQAQDLDTRCASPFVRGISAVDPPTARAARPPTHRPPSPLSRLLIRACCRSKRATGSRWRRGEEHDPVVHRPPLVRYNAPGLRGCAAVLAPGELGRASSPRGGGTNIHLELQPLLPPLHHPLHPLHPRGRPR